MMTLIRRITIILSITFIAYLGYQAFTRNTAKHWIHYKEPQKAAYMNLEKDEAILKEIQAQTPVRGEKVMNADDFVKPNIFQTIQ